MSYKLYVGNHNYSSWSLRPWVLMRHLGLPFQDETVPLLATGRTQSHKSYSSNGLVPCLHDDGFQVWDTLAIAEYLAEKHPAVWPADRLARARARSVSAEMHSGFSNLRGQMPMIIKLRLKGRPHPTEVAADIARIEEIWTECRREFGEKAAGAQAGPYLFGAFSAADAMFAPVCWRFNTYNVQLADARAAAYLQTMLSNPAMKEWEASALGETEVMPYDGEVFDKYGGQR